MNKKIRLETRKAIMLIVISRSLFGEQGLCASFLTTKEKSTPAN